MVVARGVEDVRDVASARELRAASARVGEIDRDERDSGSASRRAPAEPGHVPAARVQTLGDAPSDDAGRAGDERVTLSLIASR